MQMDIKIMKRRAWLLGLVLVGLTLMGCSAVRAAKEVNKSETSQVAGNSQGAVSSEVVVTDLVGREVKVKIPAQRVVAIGPGALRLWQNNKI